jgi:hypothetical protein
VDFDDSSWSEGWSISYMKKLDNSKSKTRKLLLSLSHLAFYLSTLATLSIASEFPIISSTIPSPPLLQTFKTFTQFRTVNLLSSISQDSTKTMIEYDNFTSPQIFLCLFVFFSAHSQGENNSNGFCEEKEREEKV